MTMKNSSGMLRRVACVRTYVSGEGITSIIIVKRLSEIAVLVANYC
jgi:hypothetical protein